jgi:hypothetical protein
MNIQTGFRVLVAFTLLLLIGSQSAQAQESWTEYKPAFGRFRVELPRVPQLETVKPPYPSPTISGAHIALVVVSERERYEVKYFDYTDGHPGAAELRIRFAHDNAPRFGAIELEERLTIGSALAIHFVVGTGPRSQSGDLMRIDNLVIARDDQLIQILCLVLPNRENANIIERIHKSLSLTGS